MEIYDYKLCFSEKCMFPDATLVIKSGNPPSQILDTPPCTFSFWLRLLVGGDLSFCGNDTTAIDEPLLVPLALFELVEHDWESQTHRLIDAMDSATMHV